jgi:hypothetical protein
MGRGAEEGHGTLATVGSRRRNRKSGPFEPLGRLLASVQSRRDQRRTAGTSVAAATAGTAATCPLVPLELPFVIRAHSQANKEALDLCERLHLLIREAEQSLRTELSIIHAVAQLGTRLPTAVERQCEDTSTAAAGATTVYLHRLSFLRHTVPDVVATGQLLLLWLRAKWALQGDGHVVAARWW